MSESDSSFFFLWIFKSSKLNISASDSEMDYQGHKRDLPEIEKIKY